MGVLKLLADARAAGLKVSAEGDRLIVRGPKSAEPLVKALSEKKAEILTALRHPGSYQPPWPCPSCGGQVRLEPAAEEHAPTRFWTCPTCGTWGATREGATYPAVWVSPGGVQ